MLETMQGMQRRQWNAYAAGCMAAGLLSACTSVAPPGGTGPAPTAGQRAAAPAALDVERQWLQSWFKDTPVRIAQRSDGAVTVEVPLEFCFDAGRSRIKPALAAVLDKVAESMRRVPALRLPLLAVPDGASGQASGNVAANSTGNATGTATGTATSGAQLIAQRGQQLHRHLVNRGVAAARLGTPGSSSTAAVQLRLEGTPPG